MSIYYRLVVLAGEEYGETGPTNIHRVVDTSWREPEGLFDPAKVDENAMAYRLCQVMTEEIKAGGKGDS
jgi:hypothetical protein